MIVSVENDKISELDKTIDLLFNMTDDELRTMQSIAQKVICNDPIERPFRKLTEEEFLEKINYSLAEADAGYLEPADKVEEDIAKELGLVVNT